MIHTYLGESRKIRLTERNRNGITNSLLESRNLFNVQTLEYDLLTASATDLDPTGNFLLIGLNNGLIDVQGVTDTNFGTLERISLLNLRLANVQRVQWNPGDELFFAALDANNLHLVDPNEMRTIEKFNFNTKKNWFEWNPNDRKIIAVCGYGSQTRLVDIRSGSSVHTLILGSNSGLAKLHRATCCLWSRQDTNCLTVGDNEGFLHVYDTRHTTRALIRAGEELGQISGMSFTKDQNTIITSQGTENRLIEWNYEHCCLRSDIKKFRKPEKVSTQADDETETNHAKDEKKSVKSASNGKTPLKKKKLKHINSLPSEAHIRCQFYVSDRHVFCPVPLSVKKSKEMYIYDIYTGSRIKTIKSDTVLAQGTVTVAGLLPDSLVLYVGGRGRLRTWTLDEAYQRKLEEKMKKYHQTIWDSDEEDK